MHRANKHRKLSYSPSAANRSSRPVSTLYFVALLLAFCNQTAGASDNGSPVPFVLPERVPFVIPDSKPVTPALTPSVTAAPLPPVSSESPKAGKKRKGKKDANPEESAGKDSEASSSLANSAPFSNGAAPSPTAATTPAAADSVSAAPAASEPASTSPASDSGSSGKRFVLQGKTEVIDFKLNDFDGYKQGMAALDKRNFALAESLFKAAAAKLDDGYEKYRAECNFFEAKCMMMQGKADQAVSLLKSAIALFDQHDPRNPYKLAAQKQVGDLLSGKGRFDSAMLQGKTNMLVGRTSVDQNITLYSRVAADDSDPVLLRVDKEAVPQTIHDCFAQMTCLETAELGSNVYNAVGRWQPLLVKGEPAAIEFGAKPPVINVKVNGQLKEVTVNLPMVNGLRRILLATDNERVAAIDVDNNDTWLLMMDTAPDGTVGRFRWALLRHAKQKSATWGVSRNVLNKPRPAGNAWGTAPHNGFGREVNVNPRLYRNSQGKY
jgi:hypothetical protein